jgi:hypothetical protein
MSFGFSVTKDEWQTIEVETSEGDLEAELRIIREVKLYEVSAVTFPAYEDTEAELASVGRALARRGSVEAIESRAAHRPELRTYLQDIREPGETTRGGEAQPVAATGTRARLLAMRSDALAARYRLNR